tara:strand:- start:977 stop:1183 length:207 start_codon:yes stop_codon:yes gene_type:complete
MKLFKIHPKPWKVTLIRVGVDPNKFDGNYIITDAIGRTVMLAGNDSHDNEINLCSMSAGNLVDIINGG